MRKILKEPVFLVLLFTAAVLLFTNLGNMYLWQDEAETAFLSRSVLKFGFPRAFDGANLVDVKLEYRPNYAWVYHPWLQFYLTAVSFFFFGMTAFAARLPFAVLGLASVFLIYILSQRLTGNKTISRLAVFLLVFSVPFMLHMRQCRFYALMVFFTLLLLLAYLDFVEKRGFGAWKLVLASFLLLNSNHGTFVGVFTGLVLHYILFYRHSRRIREVIVPFGIICLFTAGWLYYSIAWQFFGFLYTKGWEHQSFDFKLIRQNFEYYIRMTNKYIMPLAFFSIVVLFRGIKGKINPFNSGVIKKSALWLVLLVIICSLFVLIFVDVRFFRYTTHLFALFFILQAVILVDWMRSSKAVTAVVIALIVFTNFFSGNFFNKGKRRFYFFNYLYELTHDYDGPAEGAVKYLQANSLPCETAKAPYGDITLMFYTGLVLEPAVNFTAETYPDWIIIKRDWIAPKFFTTDYYKNIKGRYEEIVLDYPDLMWDNRPDLGEHKFRTVADAPRLIIYKKKNDEM